ncbi:MAG: HAMP domain-containing histidine kinase [Spirochaetaceae bacterium]|nr:HAMP domain-containing histidine kinase [Spirochaetaceae bacterium]
MKIPIRTSSGAVGLVCWVFASALTVFILGSMRDRARLIRDNDNERILGLIAGELRGQEDCGAAIAGNPILAERITGFAVYDEDLTARYRWGGAPAMFQESVLDGQEKNRFNRYTLQDQKRGKVTFVLRHERMVPEPPRIPPARSSEKRPQKPEIQSFNIFTTGKYVYIDINHPSYWRTQTLTAVLFPVCEIALFAAMLGIRRLYLRNREYRERIEGQKNLVVLGTAASTLAHEIKNPLLSIRLQTGILKKTLSRSGQEELSIIDEEVQRLSDLIYRVNDFLRDPEGAKTPILICPFLREISLRLCGRDMVRQDAVGDLAVRMDPCRARSVFENILRNALESGGDPGEIGVSVTKNSGFIAVTVADRGEGVSGADLKRVFDPFFTRKSAGTGIGLAVSKRFVEAVDGSIVLEQREGGGTLVRVRLPETPLEPLPEALARGAG